MFYIKISALSGHMRQSDYSKRNDNAHNRSNRGAGGVYIWAKPRKALLARWWGSIEKECAMQPTFF